MKYSVLKKGGNGCLFERTVKKNNSKARKLILELDAENHGGSKGVCIIPPW